MSFLLNNGNTYKFLVDDKLVGLGFFVEFNPKYVFFKFKTSPKTVEFKYNTLMLKDFLRLIKKYFSGVRRLETSVYEFDTAEIEYLEETGLILQVRKNKEVYKYNRFWDNMVYAVVDKEIENITNS